VHKEKKKREMHMDGKRIHKARFCTVHEDAAI
jgi:hypothetical protein